MRECRLIKRSLTDCGSGAFDRRLTMTAHIAFLRAINVGGRAVIKMTELNRAFVDAGCKNVRTVIASGNVLFDLEERRIATTIRNVAANLKQILGNETVIIVRTMSELVEMVESDPFKKMDPAGEIKLY